MGKESHFLCALKYRLYIVIQIVHCKYVALKFEHVSQSPEKLVTTQFAGLRLRVFDSLSLGKGSSTGISSQFPGSAMLLVYDSYSKTLLKQEYC